MKKHISNIIAYSILMMIGLINIGLVIHENFYVDVDKEKVCFTPGNSCEEMIVDSINRSKTSIDLQAYRITNNRIKTALVIAWQRGVIVRTVIDKQAKNDVRTLLKEGLPVWIDYKPAIAHNKVIIIDNKQIITGSYNFTEAAEHKNAENALLLSDSNTVKRYEDNFIKRFNVSRELN
jgi:phosphatidylserine/phosphatidylglycerophosphate/cardiolipin synthase-like enzyme